MQAGSLGLQAWGPPYGWKHLYVGSYNVDISKLGGYLRSCCGEGTQCNAYGASKVIQLMPELASTFGQLRDALDTNHCLC